MRKGMIAGIIIYIVALCLISLLVGFWIHTGTESWETNTESMEKHVGDTVVIDGDTSIVVDFSIWDDTYTLSNGVKVNKSLVED